MLQITIAEEHFQNRGIYCKLTKGDIVKQKTWVKIILLN